MKRLKYFLRPESVPVIPDRVAIRRQQLSAKREAIRPKLDELVSLFRLREDPAFVQLWSAIDDPNELVWLDKLNNLLALLVKCARAVANERESVVTTLQSLLNHVHGPEENSLAPLNGARDVMWINGLNGVLQGVRDALGEIEKKYQTDDNGFVRRLLPFQPSDYLRHFAGDAFRVHETSVDREAEAKEYKDHILCKLIGSSHLMIRSLAKAKGTKTVAKAYDESAKRAATIQDEPGALLWSTNMKYPFTYIDNPSARKNYEMIFQVFAQRRHIDVRRVHLLYTAMKDPRYRRDSPETETLLGTLIAEYLSGIDNRVLWLDHSEDIYQNGADCGKKVGCLHLLDYRLGYSPGPKEAVPGSDGSTFHILCGDFTADREEEANTGRTREQIQRRRDLAREKYEREQVYDLREPALFPLFQEHFLAMWDVRGHAARVKELYSDDLLVSELAQILEHEARNSSVFEFMAEVGILGHNYLDDENFTYAFRGVYPFEEAENTLRMNENEVMVRLQDAMMKGTGSRGDAKRIAEAKGAFDKLKVRWFPGERVGEGPAVV